MDGIVKKEDGKYKVFVKIQDGTEDCGEYATEVEARKAWKDGHKARNHNKYKKVDAPLYAEQLTIKRELVRIS